MKLKTVFSFLLVFIVGHGCKQVYEVDVSQPGDQTTPYHVFFIDRKLDDNLGVIVTDTNKREINFFYGDKNSQGALVNIDQIVTYLPQHKLLINFELDENLFPKKITSSRNDTTITLQFKNYDLKANTADVDITDAQDKLIQSIHKVSCGEVLLKFKDAKKQFDVGKGLRLSAEMGSQADGCNAILKAVSNVTSGIGCFVGLFLSRLAVVSATTGVGLALARAEFAFTVWSCKGFYDGMSAQFKGECLELYDLTGKAMTAKECWLMAVKKVRYPIEFIPCITSLLGDLSKIMDEYLNPPLPNGPTSNTTAPDYYQGGKSFGDPNIVTFDGKSYSFNGVGEFVAVKSTVDNFEIQVRQEEIKSINNSGSVSWNTGLAINTGSDKLCFYPAKYFINSTQYAYSSSINNTLQNGGSVTGNYSIITVNSGKGDIIKVFNHASSLDYSVIPNFQRQEKLIGIFGDYNDKVDNDIRIKNGSTINGSYGSLYPTFANSWRIEQAQSLFVYDAGKNAASYTDISFPHSPVAITTSQRAGAENVCKNAGVVPPFLEGCINDVVATGDNNIVIRSKASQDEKLLRSFNIDFGNPDGSLYELSKGIILENNYAYFQGGPENGASNYYGDQIDIKYPIQFMNGIEMIFYMSGETSVKAYNHFSILLEDGSGISDEIRFNFGTDYYSINYGNAPFVASTGLNITGFTYSTEGGASSDLDLYNNKIHKIIISVVPTSGVYKRIVSIDDKVIFNESIKVINMQQLRHVAIRQFTGGQSKYGRIKLYRWSFKSY